jgi:glycosyltransferase involved in cell wall biosynthesis
VGVVVATRCRPHLLRRAIESVTRQDYPGPLRIVVVYDGVKPDWDLASDGERPILVLTNWRTPGLAGARNTGILAVGDCELVAFCDDDDTWAPAKLTAQVSAMRSRPGTLFSTCAAEVEYDGRRTARLAGLDQVGIAQLTRARAGMLRPSGFVADQLTLATGESGDGIGLVCEEAPQDGEDWDLLLRAARRSPILHVDAPLVRVLWRPDVTDEEACARQADALRWLLARHPEIGEHRAHAANIYGEIACFQVAAGQRDQAWPWVRAALGARWWQPRSLAALLAALGMLSEDWLATSLLEGRVP